MPILSYQNVFQSEYTFIFDDLKRYNKSELIIICSAISANLMSRGESDLLKECFKRAKDNTEGKHIYLSARGDYRMVINKASLNKVITLILNYCNCCDCYHSEEENFTQILKTFLFANAKLIETEVVSKQLDKLSPETNYAFQRLFWPLLFSQMDTHSSVNFISELCKNTLFLKYIEDNYQAEIVTDFLTERGFENRIDYAATLAGCFFHLYASMNNKEYPFRLQNGNKVEKLFTSLCINDIENPNTTSVKSNPLYKVEDTFYVLDWYYFASQLYVGTYMCLKSQIGDNVKSELGQVFEAEYFKYIIEKCFDAYSYEMKFDSDIKEKLSRRYPDCSMKSGNNVFIFEFKDNFLSENTINSQNYDDYANKIDDIYIRKKGAKQLVDGICRLIKGEFSKDNPHNYTINYNKKDRIYPILVYTDYKYEIQGVNNYINTEFQEMLSHEIKDANILKKIQPLVFVNLDFFLNNIHSFHTKKLKLHKMIMGYNDSIAAKKRLHEDNIGKYNENEFAIPQSFQNLHMPFERVFSKYDFIYPPKESAPYIFEFLKKYWEVKSQ